MFAGTPTNKERMHKLKGTGAAHKGSFKEAKYCSSTVIAKLSLKVTIDLIVVLGTPWFVQSSIRFSSMYLGESSKAFQLCLVLALK